MKAYATIEDLAAHAPPGLLEGVEAGELDRMVQAAADEVGTRLDANYTADLRDAVVAVTIRDLRRLRGY